MTFSTISDDEWLQIRGHRICETEYCMRAPYSVLITYSAMLRKLYVVNLHRRINHIHMYLTSGSTANLQLLPKIEHHTEVYYFYLHCILTIKR